MSAPHDCVCPPQCPERCTPARACAVGDCACFQLWQVEIDGLADATKDLSNAEVHQMMLDSLAERGMA